MKLLNEMKNNISSIDENVKANTGISLDIDYNRVNFYFMMASNAADNKSADKIQMPRKYQKLPWAPTAWKMILTWMKILTRP